MDLNSIIYSEEAPKIQLVVNAKDLRDFAESMIAWGMKTIQTILYLLIVLKSSNHIII